MAGRPASYAPGALWLSASFVLAVCSGIALLKSAGLSVYAGVLRPPAEDWASADLLERVSFPACAIAAVLALGLGVRLLHRAEIAQ